MATSTNPNQPSESASSRPFRLLLGLLLLVAVAAASIAGTWFFMNWQQAHNANPVQLGVGHSSQPSVIAGSELAVKPPTPIFVPLEPFTVTVEDEQSERILRTGITLRAEDDLTRTRIERYMPEVRSRIIMLLSAQSPQSLRSAEGRNAIAQGIAQAVNKPFFPLPDGQRVTDVLFTEFVVQ